jgi:altronate hydrolase
VALQSLVARSGDTVGIALTDLPADSTAEGVALVEAIPAGHKFALRAIAAGETVTKLGHPIGRTSADIPAGAHVHVHNLHFAALGERKVASAPVPPMPVHEASFLGFVRADGRVGTRNFIGVLTSVNCSATVARRIAAHFTPQRLALFPNVDGVIAFTHMSGCGMAKDGPGLANLRRTIMGYATHPNFAAVLVVGLGCEVNQIDPMLDGAGLAPSAQLHTLGIQDAGGTTAAIARGIALVDSMLPAANATARETVSARHLTIGLQCGASDGYSGLTANPALGVAADLLVAASGRVILSETPEIYGAEDLLLARAATPAVGQALIDRLDWWKAYAARDGADLDNNPSPGNKAGGITTILEKSLGAVAKAGSSALNAVVGYAEPVTAPGLTFMDSPGYDPCSATGQIAGGANLIVFTTGRGSVFGSLPAPTLKLASNARLLLAMPDDIDFDCSPVLQGVSIDHVGKQVFEAILAAASGSKTTSEMLGLGENEWVPWIPGATF